MAIEKEFFGDQNEDLTDTSAENLPMSEEPVAEEASETVISDNDEEQAKEINKLKRKADIKKAFKVAFPYTIPVFTGYLALGVAYGVLMQTKGYGPQWSVLMSILIFGGSIQYIAITLLTTAFNPLQAFILSVMVNARHLFYGLSMLDKYKGLGKIRPFLIFWLTDETYSICSGIEPPAGINRKYFYTWISALDYSYWILGTFLGGVLGGLITFNTTGLDFVLTALFVVLFVDQFTGKVGKASGIIGLVCPAAVLFIFGADNMVILSMVAILTILLIGRKKLCS